jgi:signal transduction histidine kinase/Na+/proline symporter
MNNWLIIGSTLGYALLLFAVAWWGERRSRLGRSLVNNPWVYTLSLAVYCTAWTYFGSVGRAATTGPDFLAIYIGPLLVAPLWWFVLRKIIRICKTQNITTLADFVASRYGKHSGLGALVTLVCLFAIIPYIALQLKAVSVGFSILLSGESMGLESSLAEPSFYRDLTFYIAIGLTLFTILFGARHFDVTERHEGLVTAIAFESIVKLVAFLAVGAWVSWGLFGGPGDIFRQAAATPELLELFRFDPERGFGNWFYISFLSMLAVILLPRQFQMAVVENTDERHLNKAMWLFPLYLLVINLLVLPLALGGRLTFAGMGVDPDTYVLTLPLFQGEGGLALFAYIGGFSAATSMIIVSTAALSIMVSNSLVLPAFLEIPALNRRFQHKASRIALSSRRLGMVGVIALAYGYFRLIGEYFPLASIGMISFAGVAQLAPALLGGIFWKGGNRAGAITGLLLGFALWMYTLVVPTMVTAELLPLSILTDGPLGMGLLRPEQFLGMQGMDPIAHGLFWSLLANAVAYCFVSLSSRPGSREQNSAEVFVDIFKYSTFVEKSIVWKGTAYQADVRHMLQTILGKEKTDRALQEFTHKYRVELDERQQADAKLINYAEKLLTGAVGGASARILVASIAKKEEEISLDEVYTILQETQQIVSINRELKRKTEALRQATEQLQATNQKLKQLDHLKDEFISTVTHEMRTPLTAIRAFSEILHDSPELEEEERLHFLNTIIKETERMDRLINQVLDLERFESGKQKLQLEPLDMGALIQEALGLVAQVVKEKGIALEADLPQELPPLQADRDRLLQVLLNLLSNAIKFCQPQQGRIRVSAYYVDGDIKVKVWDNGPGIAPENQAFIFDKFYQVRNQTLKKPKGSGLGLAISKQIIEHHGGKIWVESSPEKGTKFSFLLPVVLPPKPENYVPDELERQDQGAGGG